MSGGNKDLNPKDAVGVRKLAFSVLPWRVLTGVEFYGIGKEFGAAERYYRAARSAIILAMIARIRELEQRAGVGGRLT